MRVCLPNRKFTSVKVLGLCPLILVVKAGSKVDLSEVNTIRRWEMYCLGTCECVPRRR